MNEIGGPELTVVNDAPVNEVRQPQENRTFGNRIRTGMNRIVGAIRRNSEYKPYDPQNPPPRNQGF